MRLPAMIAAATLQLLVLGWMTGQREAIVRYGDRVWLKTTPVDPRDIFRGDYVRLSYEISSLPRSLWTGTESPDNVRKNGMVYVKLKETRHGTVEAAAISDEEPATMPFLRGRLQYAGTGSLRLRYGIEAYFMQQGKALELEQEQRRDEEGIRQPLEMQVALGPGGTPVLLDHRWGPLAIGIEITERSGEDRRTAAVSVKFRNDGKTPIPLVLLPQNRSFHLIPVSYGWHWKRPREPAPEPAPEDVHLLQPGKIHALTVDLTDPRWTVYTDRRKEPPATIPELEPHTAWRFEYRPPPENQLRTLPHADDIWRDTLATSAFTSRGRID